jgi:hypothetical protein
MKKYFLYLFVFTLIFTSCDAQSDLKKWVMYRREVETDDPNYPFTVLKDGYRVVRVYTFYGVEMVEWAWRITVKNKSRENIVFSVSYFLKDKDSINLESDSSPKDFISPGEKKTIKQNAVRSLTFDEFKRVVKSKWEIEYTQSYPWQTQ